MDDRPLVYATGEEEESPFAPWMEGGDQGPKEDRDGPSLCCCQYVNAKGERSHVCAFLCDCEALDRAADAIVAGRPMDPGAVPEIWGVLEDRCRVPWRGGARRVAPEVAAAPAMVAALFFVSSFGEVPMALAHVAAGIGILLFQRKILRLRPHTKFFYAWSWSTAAFLFLEYELGVVGVASLPRTVSFWENLVLVCSACCAAASLAWAKRRAGRDLIRAGEEDEEIKKREGPRRGSARWCKVCRGHVLGKDHHCVWLNLCVSSSSLLPFYSCLVFLAATLFQLAALLLTSACSRSKLYWGGRLLLPSDCSSYNPKFEGDPGLALACGAHAALLFALVAAALLHPTAAAASRLLDAARAEMVRRRPD